MSEKLRLLQIHFKRGGRSYFCLKKIVKIGNYFYYYSQLTTLTSFLKISATGDVWNSAIKLFPVSAAMARLGSIGMAPRKGTSDICASCCPPPFEKMLVQSRQLGQMKPLMFSTMPKILRFAFLQNVSSRRTSPTATA